MKSRRTEKPFDGRGRAVVPTATPFTPFVRPLVGAAFSPTSNRSSVASCPKSERGDGFGGSPGNDSSIGGKDSAGNSRSIDGEAELALLELKREHPKCFLEALLTIARERGIITNGFTASKQSIDRLFAHRGVTMLTKKPVDRRRLEAELPNDPQQADAMQGPNIPVNGVMRRTYLFAIIDEAHLIRLELLAQLQALTRLPYDQSSLAPMILSGQNIVVDRLLFHTTRPYASRIIGRTLLEGLRREDIHSYLNHHLTIVGGNSELLSDDAVTAIHQSSGGLLRRANALAKGALLAAAHDRSPQATAEHVRLASTEIF